MEITNWRFPMRDFIIIPAFQFNLIVNSTETKKAIAKKRFHHLENIKEN